MKRVSFDIPFFENHLASWVRRYLETGNSYAAERVQFWSIEIEKMKANNDYVKQREKEMEE